MKVAATHIIEINGIPCIAYEAEGKMYVGGELRLHTQEIVDASQVGEIRRTSPNGIAFLGKEEGCILTPYRDTKGVATIGYGNTYYESGKRVSITDPSITKERALELFANIITSYEKAVYTSLRDDISQNQFDACVSLCYNIGANAFKNSTLVKRINANPYDPTIVEAFKMWRFSNGEPILLNRRIRESELYFS